MICLLCSSPCSWRKKINECSINHFNIKSSWSTWTTTSDTYAKLVYFPLKWIRSIQWFSTSPPHLWKCISTLLLHWIINLCWAKGHNRCKIMCLRHYWQENHLTLVLFTKICLTEDNTLMTSQRCILSTPGNYYLSHCDLCPFWILQGQREESSSYSSKWNWKGKCLHSRWKPYKHSIL